MQPNRANRCLEEAGEIQDPATCTWFYTCSGTAANFSTKGKDPVGLSDLRVGFHAPIKHPLIFCIGSARHPAFHELASCSLQRAGSASIVGATGRTPLPCEVQKTDHRSEPAWQKKAETARMAMNRSGIRPPSLGGQDLDTHTQVAGTARTLPGMSRHQATGTFRSLEHSGLRSGTTCAPKSRHRAAQPQSRSGGRSQPFRLTSTES